jgi:hypothetical protein
MALLEGVFNTVPRTGHPTELNAKSLCAELLRLFPNGASPISGLSAMMGTTKAKASTHGYFSKTVEFQATTLSANYSIGAATIAVTSASGLGVDDIIHNVTSKENMLITAVSGTTLTVTKAYGRIADAAGTSGQKIIKVGSAKAENSSRPTARQYPVVHVPNYTQIFRNAWAITGTAAASLMEIGYQTVAENRKDAALMHQIEQETALIWGQAKMDTTGAQPRHTTQGIFDAVRQYTSDANYITAATVGATTTLTQFVGYCAKAFKYSTDLSNPRMRYAFGDAQAIKVVNEIAVKNGSVQLTPDTTTFGMDYQNFKFYKGTLRLLEHSLLNGYDETAGRLIIVDIPSVKLAYMPGRNAKVEEYGAGGKIVENGTDGQGGSFTSEMAAEIRNPWGCVIIEGLTAGATG